MQTQYRLLYRYMNETTNTAITNEADYEKTEEFYTKDHQYNVDAAYLNTLKAKGYDLKHVFDSIDATDYASTLVGEATDAREKIIQDNMANENKSNNLYVYVGTKKYFHKQFIPDQLGYLVRDWTRVPSEQVPTGPDDYTKHFVMLGGSRLGVDNAYLVCKPQFIELYMQKKTTSNVKCFLNISTQDRENKGYEKNSSFYRNHVYIDDMKKVIDDNVMFTWFDTSNEALSQKYGEVPISASDAVIMTNSNDHEEYLVYSHTYRTNSGYSTDRYQYIFFNNKIYQGIPDYTHVSSSSWNTSGGSDSYQGWKISSLAAAGYLAENYGVNITVGKQNIMREIIPAHYEETGKTPYIIKDCYEKIPFSPWMLHSVHNSLESGLDAARKIVSMIGINNVKLIKYVPFDQFIKVQ